MSCYLRYRDNPLDCPFTSLKKCDLFGAILSGLGQLAGGLLGVSQTAQTNEANIQIARETNDANRKLFNESLAWQEDMWNKTNEYNAPSNQIKLLREAGINPAAVYGNGSTSMASSPSVPSAPNMIGAEMRPADYSFMGDAVNNGINTYFQNQLANNAIKKSAADANIAGVQAELDQITMMDRARQIINSSKSSEIEKDIAKTTLSFLSKTLDERVVQSQWTSKIMSQEYEMAVNRIAESKLSQTAMDIANRYAPKMNDLQLKSYRASVSQMLAAARASDASALDSAAHAAVNDVAAAAGRLDNNQKKILFSDLKAKASAEADAARENARKMSLEADRLGAFADYGEARTRLIGNDKIKIHTGDRLNTRLEKVRGAYQKGVDRGKRKVKHVGR